MNAAPLGPARRVDLSSQECMELLASVTVGRVVFSHHALPAVCLVSHLIDDGCVVIRAHQDASLVGSASVCGVVAYEADVLAPATRTGWSVVVTGRTSLVRASAELACYRRLLTHWADGGGGVDQVVRISPDIVTGYRLVGTGPVLT
ncbi:pyridoxamine 5'-phosphate oxidase family protein [Streptomyces sp. CT34]|uniref:pyridoxamine 5'-phosphate oxidase family protein n=1 Tax=Streptomyces sp. CT34 TaxID=1553907 RepID=UPI0005B858F4|nr:pyridoxamine 5'-phosphate oxidase family protein [Streptomyces sp. CT34]